MPALRARAFDLLPSLRVYAKYLCKREFSKSSLFLYAEILGNKRKSKSQCYGAGQHRVVGKIEDGAAAVFQGAPSVRRWYKRCFTATA